MASVRDYSGGETVSGWEMRNYNNSSFFFFLLLFFVCQLQLQKCTQKTTPRRRATILCALKVDGGDKGHYTGLHYTALDMRGFCCTTTTTGGDVTLETTTTWREQESEGGKKNKMNGGMAQDGRPGYEENVTNLIEQGGKEQLYVRQYAFEHGLRLFATFNNGGGMYCGLRFTHSLLLLLLMRVCVQIPPPTYTHIRHKYRYQWGKGFKWRFMFK